jgi:hypothetical protein
MGSRKGIPNKRTSDLMDIIDKHDFHPFEALILYAKGDHEALNLPEYTVASITKEGEPIEKLTISPELRQKSAKDACEYLWNKKRAVEHSGPGGSDLLTKLVEDLSGNK